MFRGSHHYTLDEKGRFVLPPRFREVIRAGGGDMVVLTEWDKCLWGYALNEWSRVEERLLAKSHSSGIMLDFRGMFIGSAQECSLDKQGRVLIPPELRESVHLTKEIVLVGDLNHFAIWPKDVWDLEKQSIKNEMQKPEVRNEIAQLGL